MTEGGPRGASRGPNPLSCLLVFLRFLEVFEGFLKILMARSYAFWAKFAFLGKKSSQSWFPYIVFSLLMTLDLFVGLIFAAMWAP